jgi:hypothetical protein
MQLADGRTFQVERANCIGKGGQRTCEWSSNYATRLYTAFFAITRSYDGTIRMFDLYTNGKYDYRSYNIKAIGSAPNPWKYAAIVDPLATTLARQEHEKGCADYSP